MAETQIQQEAGFRRNRPIPDDPTTMSREHFLQMLDRIQLTCFEKGQRVRVHRVRSRLDGETGTVVSAGPHSCYVALDADVEAHDDSQFRFEEHELELLKESVEDEDDPKPYLAALDYVALLKQAGYKLNMFRAYRKHVPLGVQTAGYLRITVVPRDMSADITVDYDSRDEAERIMDMLGVDAIDVIDVVREIEEMAVEGITISAFAVKLHDRNFPNSHVVTTYDQLHYLFGESLDDPDDDPQRYFQELQRHGAIINMFRDQGLRMGRRMSTENPYYRMFWIPGGVSNEVTYDVDLEPLPDKSWRITAKGLKRFEDERTGDKEEYFDIDHEWHLPANATEEELLIEVDNITSAISEYRGPEEYTPEERDWDDIDESAEEDEITDPKAYAIGSASYNPVQLLTAKDLRGMVRELGFKVLTIYRSRVHHGWSLATIPGTGQAFELFKKDPYAMASFMETKIREGIMKRLPALATNAAFNAKLDMHCWQWSGTTSANPENPRNWTIYVDVMPKDWHQYKRGGIKENAEPPVPDPDADLDVKAYAFDTLTPDLGKLGYHEVPEAVGSPQHWYKQVDERTQFVVYLLGAPEFEFNFHAYELVTLPNSGMQHWRSLGASAGHPLRTLRQNLVRWEQRVKEGVLLGKQSGAMVRLTQEDEEDDDDPQAYLKRTRAANMGELVDVTCPHCGDKRRLFKNWPDNMPEWGSKCGKCGGFISLPTVVVDSVSDPDDPAVVMAHAQTCPRCESANTRKTGGEGGREYWTCGDCGDKFLWSADRKIRLEGVDDPDDDPQKVLRHHKPRAYALYGQYAAYDNKVSFSIFTSLEDAVIRARERDLHGEYDYVWADEVEFDSLEKWDTGETMACMYTGIQYRILPNYETERVVNAEGGAPPPFPPIGESEADDDAVDPEAYFKTTYDIVNFLETHGWRSVTTAAYDYWGKDFPLPHQFRLGGMVFDRLRATIGFDQRYRGAYSCHVNVHWVSTEDYPMAIRGWELSPQLIYPDPDPNDISDIDYDFNLPLRRFAHGIEKVLTGTILPNTDAALHANSFIESAVAAYVKELNAMADKPIQVNRPLGEADEDDDAPDLQHWGQRLSPEERLDKLLGAGRPYFRDEPDAATKWSRFFNWEWRISGSVEFTIFYKRVQMPPCAGMRYDVHFRAPGAADWDHHDHEMVHGQEHVLKMVEILEQVIAELEVNPPKQVTELMRALKQPLDYAYKISYGQEDQ